VTDLGNRQGGVMRDRFNTFVATHEMAWELAMAALAILYVAIGFAHDTTTRPPPAIQGCLLPSPLSW
jgi:hypothetical protein